LIPYGQSQVQFSTWHPHGDLSALSGTCDEETQRDFNAWRWVYVKKYECILKIKKAIKILKKQKNLPMKM
jgi:hypothetical protein